jgi:hypothetical protein
MSSNVISDDILGALRAEAQSAGGGNWIRLDEKGDWAIGVVKERFIDEAPFGEVEALILTQVRAHDGDRDPDQEITFRLSRSVLRRELGSEADDGGAKPGMIVFIEANGERMSKAGKAYFAYSVKKSTPKDAQKSAKDNAGAAPPKRKAADVIGQVVKEFDAEIEGKDDIPF